MEDKKFAEYKDFEIKELLIEEIYPNEWNPNVQKDAVFNALVSNIQEIGFVEPIMVTAVQSKDDSSKKYKIISGEHRWEACKVLGFEKIHAVVRDDFDEDMEKFMTVRMNVLKGEMDSIKFTKLFDQLAKKYSDEVLKDVMGFVDESKFQQVYRDIRKGLPKKLKQKLDDTRDEIQNVDDLSRVLNDLFSKYGDTLDHNFMVFTYGGKVHLWVLMSDKLKKKMVDDITPTLVNKNLDMSIFIEMLIDKYGDAVQEEMISTETGVLTYSGDDEIEVVGAEDDDMFESKQAEESDDEEDDFIVDDESVEDEEDI